jgi:Domain of unknown function (DUF4365)
MAVVLADPLGNLPLSAMKEQFSLGYVHMVASAAGFSVKTHGTDYDGVDVTIYSSAEYAIYYGPQFELQVKCTSQSSVVRQRSVAWQMQARPFRKLTSGKRYIPAYLGVLVVPGDPEAWLQQDQEKLLTRSRMYWQEATQLGAIDDGAGSKTVHLPLTNLFDVPQLQRIMKSLGDGGDS